MNTRNLRFRSNRVRDIVARFREDLAPLYPMGEIDTFIAMLFEAFLQWSKVQLMTHRDATIDQSDLLRFHWALEDLLRHRPIQHIIGHTHFCGCHIEVSPDVLIPRPETEEMATWTLDHLATSPATILDLCTGSGCLAIALAKAFPEAATTAVDLSTEALAVAQRNAARNNVDLNLIHADILHWKPTINYDLITANPPYVLQREKQLMQPNVLDYEPHQALFVADDDPLLFYRAVATIAQRHLVQATGLLVAEINEAFGTEVCALFEQHGLHPTLHRDFRDCPRWVSATPSH